jgi:glyceraldehyde-3-phosphate dehydrogenase (NAD(P))
MSKVKVAINGYGTIGKRVADAVQCRRTWNCWHLPRPSPNYEAFVALVRVPCVRTCRKLKGMEKGGIRLRTIEDMIQAQHCC